MTSAGPAAETAAGPETGSAGSGESAGSAGSGESATRDRVALPAASRGGREALRAHWQTWRPYTLSYPGLVGLAGAALADGHPTPLSWATAWAAPTLGWVSGHYLGDFFDRDLDGIGKPQRPIPSGRLTPGAAVVCGVVCALAAAAAAAFANWRAVLLVALAMAGIVAYSRLLKGTGLSGNVVRGALTATTVAFGAMTVDVLPPWRVLPFALAFCAHDAASNLVGALRDVEGDRHGGYLTFPVRRGTRVAAWTAALLYAAALVTALVSVHLTATDRTPFLPDDRQGAMVLLLIAAACGAYAFAPLLRTASWAPRRALRAHEVLVGERLVLAGAVLASGRGLWAAVAVTLPLLALSLLAQARMRAGHEFPSEADGYRAVAVPEPPVRPSREDDAASC